MTHSDADGPSYTFCIFRPRLASPKFETINNLSTTNESKGSERGHDEHISLIL